MSDMTGLEKIRERILNDAKEDARRILETAQADCRRIAEDYAAQAEATRNEIAERAEREGERLISRARSDATMTQRNILLETRASLVDEAFERAKARLRDDDGNKYLELLSALLVGALVSVAESEEESARFGDEVVEYDRIEVLMNEEDRDRYGTAVVEAARRTAGRRIGERRTAMVRLADETVRMDGGLVLRCGDIEINCSLSMLLADLRAELEPKVSAVLFS